jgi:WD40 repeat protein
MVNHSAYSPDGQYIAVALSNGTIKVMNTKTGSLILSIIAHTGAVRSVNYSPDGRNMTSTSPEDNTAKVWDAITGELIHVFTFDS